MAMNARRMWRANAHTYRLMGKLALERKAYIRLGSWTNMAAAAIAALKSVR